MAQQQIKDEMDQVIHELEKKGIKYNQGDDMTGLGDVVEGVLTSMGITQERFKQWFNLKSVTVPRGRNGLTIYFLGKRVKDSVDLDDKYDILDVLFVVEALTVGYFVYYLWGTI